MAQFRKTVITKKGIALVQKTQMQNIRMEFTKIRTGSGAYEETEILDAATGLKESVQEYPFLSQQVIDPQTIKLVSVISNKGLDTPYYLREIGVYANDPDEGEILYSLAVAYPDKADYIPAYDGRAPVTVSLDTYQSVSNSENVDIQVDPGAYASARELKELKERFEQFVQDNPRVAFGSASDDIPNNTILFITDEGEESPVKFGGAVYTNVQFGQEPPAEGENWMQTGENIIQGKLAVSEESPSDAAFFVNIKKED